MQQIAKRMKELRKSLGVSQEKLAEWIGISQSAINRYENAQATPSTDFFRKYADFFDVSLDYVFCRTNKPQGQTYEFKPQITPDKEELRRFIEMCFDPNSPVNEKLKQTLFEMLEGKQ